MANVDNGVIQFTCEHCKISLTVDDFLAGVSAPCPSCGKPTKAPDQRAEGGAPDVLSGLKPQHEVVRPPVGQKVEQDRDWDTGRPRIRLSIPDHSSPEESAKKTLKICETTLPQSLKFRRICA